METDGFSQHNFGKIALLKMGDVPQNFRIYYAGWLGKKPDNRQVMKVKGAEFRIAKKGKNKGKLCVLVEGSKRSAYVTAEEIENYSNSEVALLCLKVTMRSIDELISACIDEKGDIKAPDKKFIMKARAILTKEYKNSLNK